MSHLRFETLKLDRVGKVATLTLNRPDARNSMNGAMLADLSRAIEELTSDSSIRALVITGAGKGFCAGADVTDPFFSNPDRQMRLDRAELGYGLVAKLHAAPFPLLAAINGSCVATGVSLAALCDVRIAANDAVITLGFARVGIFPDLSGSVMLPRLVGTSRAIELTFLDDPIDAQRAVEIGLVTKVVASDQLMNTSMDLAARLATRSPLAVRLTRHALRELPNMGFKAALEIEAEMVVNHAETFDLAEGTAAIRERRTPNFIGK